jgi:hypothetical protein
LDKLVGDDGRLRARPLPKRQSKSAGWDGWGDEEDRDLAAALRARCRLPGEAGKSAVAAISGAMIDNAVRKGRCFSYPKPDITDDQARRWGVFASFLERECGYQAQSAGDHIDWILRRDFKTPEEWLGAEGIDFRRRQGMWEHHPDVSEAWSEFEAAAA